MEIEGHFDLIVAGGGPAGTAAAITAARLGRRVLLLDKSNFPRHKVCGEFVSPESIDLLSELLGEHAAALLRRAPAIDYADVYHHSNHARLPITPAARSVSRHAMDKALWEAAVRAGVTEREHISVRSVKDGRGFVASTDFGEVTASAFINATGRWSELSRHSGREGWIGYKAHFMEPTPQPGVQLYFFPGGYCGVQAVGADVINVCAVAESGQARGIEDILGLHPVLQRRSSQRWRRLTDPLTTYPLVFRPETPVTGNMINVGDAAAFVDPFIGDGISIALQTGVLAARALSAASNISAAVEIYAHVYREHVSPVLRRAAQLRRVAQQSSRFTSLASLALRSPFVSQWAVDTTRATLQLDLRDAI